MSVWRWSETSVRTKLTVITMAVCIAALAVASAGVLAYQIYNGRQQLVVALQGAAAVVGDASTAAVQFRDAEAASEALAALKVDDQIEAARIELVDGTTLASYGAEAAYIPAEGMANSFRDLGQVFVVSRPVLLDGQPIGIVRVRASLDRARAQARRASFFLLAVLLFACAAAYGLSSVLQRVVSEPILALAETAGQVSTSRDYGLRVAKVHNDELGRLVDEFNGMLGMIEVRDAELREAHNQLEARVADRTRNLELEIVERRRTENELILAKATAEEASRAKSAFLANMSHELRTPLNAIIGYSEILMEDAAAQGAPDSCTADIGKIIAAGRHLLALINDVLDLSKIEAGRMDIDASEFEAAELIRGVASTTEPLATTRGNVIRVATLEGLGAFRTDRLRLQQILLNLFSNACKFTKDGVVTVSASREQVDGQPWTSIHVADTGIGMTLEQRENLFREFVQADASTTRRYGGTGLGLAISQRLAKLLGGEITVESTLGHGSVFTVRLPVHREAPATRPGTLAAERKAVAPMGASARTVVVIDDDNGARDIAVRALRKAGYRTCEAIRADDGLALIRAERPMAVVLDVILPGRNGWSLLEELNATPDLASIPVVIVSVHDSRHQSVTLGALEHLTKPLRVDRLLETLHGVSPVDSFSPSPDPDVVSAPATTVIAS